MQFIKTITSSVLLLVISSAVNATVYQFEDLNANNGGIADRLDSISSTYDDVNEIFTWDVTFNANPTDVDGFWLVVNNGPNPKSSNVNELAIMYGDMTANNGVGILTTYVYNGQNSSSSFKNPGIFLQSDTFSFTDDSLSLSIDVTTINAWSPSPDYSGVSYDDEIGIWFHISTGSSFNYNGQELVGNNTGYSYASQGWYDRAGLSTTVVPEPASLALLGVAMLGVAGLRRK